jgi:HK97 family phage portal protein
MDRPVPSGRVPSRHDRVILEPEPGGGDPRIAVPNDNGSGPNLPPVSVGPTSSTNTPGNFVMSASAWSGWPAPTTPGAGGTWATPPLEQFSTTGGGEWTGYGYGRQNPSGYLKRVSTVMTCADLNVRQIASFPAYAVKDRRPAPLPSWYDTGPEPELYPDWTAFMKAAGNSYWLAGEVILWATGRYANGYPARFIALNPHNVYVDGDGDWYIGHDDTGERLNRADICHIPYQMLPGAGHRRGIGPLRWTHGNLISAATLASYAASIAQYGVWAVLKHPDELTATQAAEFQAQWMFSRYHNPGAPAVLSGGIELETVTMSPKDLALLDLMWFDLEMIAAAFGVPSVLVNLPTNNGLTYSTTTMLADWHWRATLRTAVQSFSGPMSTWLLPRGTVIEWNPDRYVQPPLEEQARTFEILARVGAMSSAEIREALRLAPADNNDADALAGLIGAERG